MLKAGIVGLGRWGQVLVRSVHGKSDRIRFVRAIAHTPAKAEAFGREMGLTVSGAFEHLLVDPAVEAVVIASPHSQHAERIVSAAR